MRIRNAIRELLAMPTPSSSSRSWDSPVPVRHPQAAGAELGDRVRDRISGVGGIVIGVTDWLYGCRRITLSPEEAKDGRPAEGFTLDEAQVEVVEKGVVRSYAAVMSAASRTIVDAAGLLSDTDTALMVPPPRPAGPRGDPGRRTDPTR